MSLSLRLTNWYSIHKRDLPWRRTKNPYKIWLSEIILQQTRIDQGMAYFLKFSQKYPTVADLAKADLDEVLKDWEGLGYYSRARNLHHTANDVVQNYGGVFPDTYAELIKLKGVGIYTATAIASFSKNEQKAVVDGNVYRFLGRLFDIEKAIDSSEGQKLYQKIANEILPKEGADIHNQAMMEFGALQCTKHQPNCAHCVFQADCLSLKNQTITERPVKKGKTKVIDRYLDYYFIHHENHFLIEQRNQKGIWHKLYQFPLEESKDKVSFDQHIPNLEENFNIQVKTAKPQTVLKHLLSHQRLYIRFWNIESLNPLPTSEYQIIEVKDIPKRAFPKPIFHFLNEKYK